MNTASTDRRKYELKARAEQQRQTRERMVAATVALHEEVGPARTTIADIARRAGVQRLTVYNSFPDARELFRACQSRFLTENPPPNLAVPASTSDPVEALRAALADLYTWYRATRPMEEKVHRDRHLVPDLDALMADTGDRRLDTAADAHAAAIGGQRSSTEVRALIRLALEFRTWELLARDGLTDAAIARLLTDAVSCAARADST